MNDEIATIDAGITHADGPDKAREYADVAAWQKRIMDTRKWDEEARKQYAKDRRYARGDSVFLVDDNIVGTNIDILESFLYARDPDVDVLPAKSCRPPSIETVRDAAEETVQRSPGVAQIGAQVAAQAIVMGLPQQQAIIAGQMAENAKREEMIRAEFDRLQERYARRMRDTKQYSETVEIVISHLWRNANLKARGRRFVRSGLTIGLGILKASWQERTAPSPETVAAINDLQDNIKRAAAQRAALDDASGTALDAQTAEYQRQLKALKGQAEQVVARGYVIDQVAGEDFQVAPGYQVASHLDAPWNAHRIAMLKSDVMATFGLTADQIKGATIYMARKPVMKQLRSANEREIEDAASAADADAFVAAGSSGSGSDCGEAGEWVMVWEVWDRQSNHVLTLIEGMKCWAKPAWEPTATERFYPFFLFTTAEVDGQRHPQSLVSRASKLVDAYNRIASQEEVHRKRINPKMLFLKGQIGGDAATKIVESETGEWVGVETTQPNASLASLFIPCPYPGLDPALYDRTRLMNAIERIFGVQEALSGSVTVAKTAREAEIQQGGFQARTGGRRDYLEMVLQELAQYTAEIARAHMDADDVRAIAGPDALWPEYVGAADLNTMVQIEIRAGSSGKPNTTAEREAWAQQLPLLQNAIVQIGQLRNSLPTDVADCLEKLLQITADRSGDRLDMDQLVPKIGPPPAPMPVGPDGAPLTEPGNGDAATAIPNVPAALAA
ncbi:MAG: hypothetical protein ACREO8_10165 [Luteimonas sp.]